MSEKTTTIHYSEATAKYQQTTDTVDQNRTDALTNLLALRKSKHNSMQREQLRLTDKLGADHPRVKKLDVLLQTEKELQRDLQWGVERGESQDKNVAKDTWILHGRVFDAKNKAVPGLSVTLETANGDILGKAVNTNRSGYYKLIYKPDAATTAGKAVQGKYTLKVNNKEGVTIKEKPLVLKMSLGTSTYIEIFLDAEEKKNTPPKKATTAVQTKKTTSLKKAPAVKKTTRAKTTKKKTKKGK